MPHKIVRDPREHPSNRQDLTVLACTEQVAAALVAAKPVQVKVRGKWNK